MKKNVLRILDGRTAREALLSDLMRKIQALPHAPSLAIIQVGDRADSTSYIRGKKAFAQKIGVTVKHIQVSETISGTEVIKMITDFNADAAIQGIILQLPLPAHIDQDKAVDSIDPGKDVDALTSYSVKGWNGEGDRSRLIPATARGVRELLEHYEISLKGKRVTVVGRSALVGAPISVMCRNEGAVVTVCHSKTEDLAKETSSADILIVAVGKPGLIGAKHVKEGEAVIDVGISRTGEETLSGDVDFEAVKAIVSAISPVPGGVGPMTVLALFENLVDLCTM